MQVDIISTNFEFSKLKTSWNNIYSSDPEAQFFLSWDWLSQVFLHYEDWFIIAVRRGDTANDYVAFFPLQMKTRMSKSSQDFYNVIRVAGRHTWSDYAGFICDPKHQQQAIPLLASKLTQMSWRDLILKNLLISEERLKLFTTEFDNEIFSFHFRDRIGGEDNINLLVSPYVDLPDDYDTFLSQNLSSNSRQKARRFLRKLENGDDLHITLSTPKTYQRDVDFLIEFWKDKWLDRKGEETSRLAKQYRQILDLGFKNNTLFMPVLWKEGKPIGVLGTFIDRQKHRLLYFIAGRDEQCNNPPPGFILHAYSIRWAIENGFKVYDFLRGNEPFKYSFGAIDQKIHYLVINTRSGTNLNNSLDPNSVNDALKIATRYQRTGQTSKAETGFQQVLDVAPENEIALRRCARLYYQSKEFTKAKMLYQRLLEINPHNTEIWRNMGKALLATEQFTEAELAIRKSIALDAKHSISNHYYLGYSLQKQEKYVEASTEFSALLMLKAKNVSDKNKQNKAQRYLETN